MREWKAGGGRIVAVTNQGGVALGYLSADDCRAATARTLELTEGLIDVVAMCTHHPRAINPEKASYFCRKPFPGLIFDHCRLGARL